MKILERIQKNQSMLSLSENNEATITNNASVGNSVEGNATTGNNDASKNTGNGSIATGNAGVVNNLKNYLNQTIIGDTVYFVLVNVMGQWKGMSLLPIEYLGNSANGVTTFLISNINTGAGSENNASLEISKENNLELENNAGINNNIKLTANTGENSASLNTGNGTVETGDASILANIFNFANTTIIAKKFMLLVVNVFGDWTGNITTEVAKSEDQEQTNVNTNTQNITGVLGSNYREVTEVLTFGQMSVIIKNINPEETVSVPAVLAARTDDWGIQNKSETENQGFIARHLGTILFSLFCAYLLSLLIYKKVKKNREKSLGGLS